MTDKSKAFERLLRRFRLMKDSLTTTHADWNRFIVQCISQGFSIEEVKEHIKQQDEERRRKLMEKKELSDASTDRHPFNVPEITEDMIATSSMQCLKCGAILTGDAYFKIEGSIFVGETGGVIGGTPNSVSRFCMNCFIEEIERIRDQKAQEIQNRIAELEKLMNTHVLTQVTKRELDIPDFMKDMTPEQKTSVIRLIQNVTD